MARQYTVADAILDTLKAHKVETIFGYPGGAILPFYDALPYHKEIKHILTRHEQACAFAAQGVARTTQKIGVCCATSGPGATNLITGIADAFLDSIPLLVITGQVPLKMIGKDMFQEVDTTGITQNITKHNYILSDPKKTVEIVSEAIAIAMHGRPGPVHIDVPKDIMAAAHPEKFEIPKITLPNNPQNKAFQTLENDLIEKVMHLLQQAKRPVLLVGQGVKHSHAEKEVKTLIRKLNLPAVTTLLAKGIFDNHVKGNKKDLSLEELRIEEENYLGMLGMHGFYHANQAIAHADLIINIGSRFDDRIVGTYDSFGKNAKIIHVDIDQAELQKVVEVEMAIHSDAKQFIEQLLSHPSTKNLELEQWHKQIQDWKKLKAYEKNTKDFTIRSVLSLLMGEVNKTPDDYIFVTDVGQHQMWTALSTEVTSSKHWLSSGGSGTMGFGLPTALGAAEANPNKTIIVISGDGGIQMNIQELATIKDQNYNIKTVIVNNSFLGMVRQWQELFYEHNYSQVNITSPNYSMLAEAYGIKGLEAKSQEELSQLIQAFLTTKGPQVLECKVVKEDNVFPMVPGGKTLAETIVSAEEV